MKYLQVVFLVAVLITSAVAGEKGERDRGMHRGPKIDRLLNKLDLDKGIEKQIKAVFREFHKKRSLLDLNREEHQIALKKMILTGEFDMAKIRANCEKRGKIWTEMQILGFEQDMEIKKLLTSEQWDTYLTYRIEKHDRMNRKKGGKNKGPGGYR